MPQTSMRLAVAVAPAAGAAKTWTAVWAVLGGRYAWMPATSPPATKTCSGNQEKGKEKEACRPIEQARVSTEGGLAQVRTVG